MSVGVKVSEYVVPAWSTLEFPTVRYLGHWFEGSSRKDALQRAGVYFGEGPSFAPALASIKDRGWEIVDVPPFSEVPAWADFDDKEHRMNGGRLSNPGDLFTPGFDVNHYVMSHKAALGGRPGSFAPIPRIVCKNGFSFSVQAGAGVYCSPRLERGPWKSFEVGYPSRYVPDLMPYLVTEGIPATDSVYADVPESVINKIVQRNGGAQ